MFGHFFDENIISDKQHGFTFRKGHCCKTQLITTGNDLLASADVGPCGYRHPGFLLGIRHCFSSQTDVQTRSLWYKRKHLFKWISSFLHNRNQKVVIDGYSSDTIFAGSEVPHGSVLDLIICLVFINDLPDLVKSQCRLFADDCLLYNEIKL